MNHRKMKDFVLLALFVALIALLGFTPLGLIPLGFINVTILCVPVIVGTLYMGRRNGMILGLAFGVVSFISALIKPSALVSTLMGASPLLVAVMSILPRVMVPVVADGVYRLFGEKKPNVAVSLGAVCGSVTNTVLYLGLMLLFYILCGIDNTQVLTTIGFVAGGAGPLEAVAAAIIVPPILTALWRIKK